VLQTFLGAFLAFLFAGIAYNLQRKKEAATYAKYCVAIISSRINNIVNLKKGVLLKRKKECEILDNNKSIQISHISKKLLQENYNLLITIEKLSFISSYNPNIVCLLINTIESCHDLSITVKECNRTFDLCYNELNEKNLDMLIKVNKSLFDQTETTHYLLQKSSEVLFNFSKSHFNQRKYLSGIKLSNEDWRSFKPEPIESYEKEDWNPELSVIDKIRAFFFV